MTARNAGDLVGFVNVIWDGLVYAGIEDVMVAVSVRNHGVGVPLVNAAGDGAKEAGCGGCTSISTTTFEASTTTPAAFSRATPG